MRVAESVWLITKWRLNGSLAVITDVPEYDWGRNLKLMV